ncbi:hypothetical protein KPL74_10965 [Bacillus sp. NP157]|nr:hypothetical protein KPL74_10965 [Bacillus sp. NP157]
MSILDRNYLKQELPARLDRAQDEGQIAAGTLADRINARRQSRQVPEREAPSRAPRAFGWDNSRAQADDNKERGGRDR